MSSEFSQSGTGVGLTEMRVVYRCKKCGALFCLSYDPRELNDCDALVAMNIEHSLVCPSNGVIVFEPVQER